MKSKSWLPIAQVYNQKLMASPIRIGEPELVFLELRSQLGLVQELGLCSLAQTYMRDIRVVASVIPGYFVLCSTHSTHAGCNVGTPESSIDPKNFAALSKCPDLLTDECWKPPRSSSTSTSTWQLSSTWTHTKGPSTTSHES